MESNLYFDYSATTPIHPAVKKAMLTVFDGTFGNPSSMHLFGRQARKMVEKAREQVAVGLGASPEEVTFTSGATEANNLAMFGTMRLNSPHKNHLIVSAIEHHAVLHTAEALAKEGFQVTYLPVDRSGCVAINDLEAAIRPETGLISIMMVNNEVGSIQDIAAFGALAKKHKLVFHTDAVQAVNCFEIDVDELQVDMLSISAHKIYGPKGIGALYIREGLDISPILFGGAQEQKIRPGTENVSGIVGLGEAMALRNGCYKERYEKYSMLRSLLKNGLEAAFPGVIFNGPDEHIAPHILSTSFPNVDAELLMFNLSQEGLAVSMGSACTSEAIEPSHVLTAMGLPEDVIEGTLRISIGEFTTQFQVETFLAILPDVIARASLVG